MTSLDVWPHLPLLIKEDIGDMPADNTIAELEHSDHIRLIDLKFYKPLQIETFWTAMEVPFPELATLYLSCGLLSPYVPVLPDSFLGGSAPRLRQFYLEGIPFLGLPKVLLFATHLVTLGLSNIPPPGYVSQEAVATCVSVMPSIENLYIQFLSSLSM